VKSIKLRRRVLRRRFDRARWQRSYSGCFRRRQQFNEHNGGRIKRGVPGRQHARALLGNHRLAAVMVLIGARALHGRAALHALLIRCHGGHAIGKLQEQQSACCQHEEYSLTHHVHLSLRFIRRGSQDLGARSETIVLRHLSDRGGRNHGP